MWPAIALIGLGVYFGLVFAIPELSERRRTGRSSWVAPASKGRVERRADAIYAIAFLLTWLSPVLVLAGVLEPALDAAPLHALGAVVLACAALAARWAQAAMGSAWRTGGAGEHGGDLVVEGAFALARHPVYTTMIAAAAGAAMLAPTAAALAGVLAFAAALELQARAVEEPALRARYGQRYAAYAARTGRFVPGVGRLR